jgi:hypothetical protein
MLTLDENHVYRWNGVIVPGVSEILEAGGFTDFSHVNSDVLEAAQKFGKAVHKTCELEDEETLNEKTLSSPLVPYLNAWRKFKKDFNVQIIVIEYKFYSEKWNFAGTLDRILHIGEKNILADIKSSSSMQAGTQLQTAGYKIGIENEQKKFKCHIDERWGVQLCGDGLYKIHKYHNRTDKSVFLGALQGYWFKKENNLL